VTASPATANHLAELDARFDAHLEALHGRVAQAQTALDRALAGLAAAAAGATAPSSLERFRE
jgi:hypothetical protein